jgi:hypothetical protein
MFSTGDRTIMYMLIAKKLILLYKYQIISHLPLFSLYF